MSEELILFGLAFDSYKHSDQAVFSVCFGWFVLLQDFCFCSTTSLETAYQGQATPQGCLHITQG